MAISKINHRVKNECKIVGTSLMCGACLGLINMASNKVSPKDVFQYKNLTNQQKHITKCSAIGALAVAALLWLGVKINTNNKL